MFRKSEDNKWPKLFGNGWICYYSYLNEKFGMKRFIEGVSPAL